MFQAQFLRNGSEVLGPWQRRAGDYFRTTAELVAGSDAGTLTVQVFTKNSADSGDGTNVDGGTPTEIVLSAVGRETVEWSPSTGSGLKELIRYKFIAGGEFDDDWILFRTLPELWFDGVTA
jgi:hypothetical protein